MSVPPRTHVQLLGRDGVCDNVVGSRPACGSASLLLPAALLPGASLRHLEGPSRAPRVWGASRASVLAASVRLHRTLRCLGCVSGALFGQGGTSQQAIRKSGESSARMVHHGTDRHVASDLAPCMLRNIWGMLHLCCILVVQYATHRQRAKCICGCLSGQSLLST